MKIKKVSNNSFEVFDNKDKSLLTFTKYDFDRLANSQIGCSLNFY